MSPEQQWDIVSGVGLTALAVAAGRALETRRPDALVDDPYALAFLDAAEAPVPLPTTPEEVAAADGPRELWALMTEYLGVRSRVFDDFLTGAARAGTTQLVLLASGLDTRAFRLTWPAGTRCFELDRAPVLDFKLGVLDGQEARPGCAHVPVPVDLREDWAAELEAAGFDATRPTAWLAEGLLPYLPPEAEEQLFKEIDRLSPAGSALAVEHASGADDLLADPLLQEGGAAFGIDLPTLLPGGTRRTPQEQLAALGWTHETRTARASAEALGRTLDTAPTTADRMQHTFAHRP
ncbi:SAM-dependent methyltransferase [Streptomyces sp. NHF165]|uniref:SAM-dependent methyltransferase n=1 Tax=Streptomyces sp. NHF165 TaxID=2175864 RepID=UPI00132ECE04|nr:SAM-dependent methyltransferase [Streptomyces sp. NHF165]QHF93794.1 SAM-dependent methyltransferase [Streptomyces sp. NHF165]